MVAQHFSKFRPANSFVPQPPDGRSRGTLSQAIREHLCRHDGTSTLAAILRDLQADRELAQRLEDGQGLARLLRNMQYSGFLIIEGEVIKATTKTLQRTLV